MRLEVYRKIVSIGALEGVASEHRAAGRRIVHCHGCFDVVHPGHVRYLEHARRRGDVLVVSLTGDDAIEKSDGTRPYIPERYRAENLAALAFVDHVVIAPGATAEPVIRALRPDLYVKGQEYEGSSHPGFLAEKQLVESLGGRVMFSSGDVVFSSSAIVESLHRSSAVGTDAGGPGSGLESGAFDPNMRLAANCERWGVDHGGLSRRVAEGFAGQRVLVVGDAVLDRYVACEASDVASEAPILSVRPTRETSYLGGAAVIAAHVRGLGGEATLVTRLGEDDAARDLATTLQSMGVTCVNVPGRPDTPRKQRYLVDDQKLLKVDRGEPAAMDLEAQRRMADAVLDHGDADAAIFVDFGYGAVSTPLLEAVVPGLRKRSRVLAGDVSGPRRSLLAMRGFDLMTPTERELRGVMGDFEGSLPTVTNAAMRELGVPRVVVTLGAKGSVLFHPRNPEPGRWFEGRLRSDYLPALSDRRLDVVGAGDALLAASAMATAAGASPPEAAYLGSLAASVTVGRLGNVPITADDLRAELRRRPELHASRALPAAG